MVLEGIIPGTGFFLDDTRFSGSTESQPGVMYLGTIAPDGSSIKLHTTYPDGRSKIQHLVRQAPAAVQTP